MAHLRIAEAAELLGVSDDTVRRWTESGRLDATRERGHIEIDAVSLAEFAQANAHAPDPGNAGRVSARNQLKGIVTRVIKDTVMAQVDVQAGPFRMVSLLSREAVDEMDLKPGSVAVVSIKATNVVIETPSGK